MMQHEFERIAGYEVSYEDYTKIIEPMYNATDLDKFEFVKVIDRKRFDLGAKKRRIVKNMKRIAAHLKETFTHYTDYEAREELERLANEYKELIKAEGFYISEIDIWTCSYPKRVEFYDARYYTFKRIDLV